MRLHKMSTIQQQALQTEITELTTSLMEAIKRNEEAEMKVKTAQKKFEWSLDPSCEVNKSLDKTVS